MNYLITGVSKGLGLEICKVILKNPDNKIWGLSRTMTEPLSLLMSEYSGRLKWMSYDLSNSDDVRQKIFKEFIGDNIINGYVNNAAMAYDDIITNLNYDSLTRMYAVNVFTPMMIVKYILRHFILKRIKGSIVHVSSISVHTGYKGLAMYASSKGALEAFSKNTAREWGEYGIRSNCVIAGFMETEMSSSLTQDQKNRIYKRTSLKMPTSANSVANMIDLLLSEKSMSVTGQNINVDSGTI